MAEIKPSYPGTIPSPPPVHQSCRPLLVSSDQKECRYERLTQLQWKLVICSAASCQKAHVKIKQDRVSNQAICNFDVNNTTRKNLQSNSCYRIHFEEYVCVTFAWAHQWLCFMDGLKTVQGVVFTVYGKIFRSARRLPNEALQNSWSHQLWYRCIGR